jgi:hypothetical protein
MSSNKRTLNSDNEKSDEEEENENLKMKSWKPTD